MISVVEVIREIVAAVSEELTPTLQAYDSAITGVHYQHGHPIEIIETLGELDESRNFKFDRYPLIALFQDFPENIQGSPGDETNEPILHLIIARSTSNTYKAGERYSKNFDPVLIPVYLEFIKQLKRSRFYAGGYQLSHTKTDRLYWGREGLYKNDGNIFNDFIDAIEIKDLRIKFGKSRC